MKKKVETLCLDGTLIIVKTNNMIQSTIIVALVALPALAYLCWMWVNGIDYMKENHPDYKGDDLFGEFDEDDKNQIG